MTKFKEGEVVRSVLKGDEKFPFFKIHRVYPENFPGVKGQMYLAIRLDNGPQNMFDDLKAESSLRHTEYDTAGDE